MSKRTNFEEVPVEKLRWRCDPENLNFTTTDEVEPCDWIIGQDRAVKAIKLGLDIKSIGYNIFVTGFVGTGRLTTIKHLLERLEKREKRPDDKCYVNNFKNPDMPRIVSLPAGQAKLFKKDMENLILSLKRNIPRVLESENYQERRRELVKESEDGQKAILQEFEDQVKEEGFALVQIQMGPFVKPDVQPLVEGKPTSLSKLEKQVKSGKFPEGQFKTLEAKYSALGKLMEDVFKAGKEIVKELEKALEALDKEIILPLLRDAVKEIKVKYENGKIQEYLQEVEEGLINDLDRFRRKKEEQPPLSISGLPFGKGEDEFLEYQVNVLVDNSETQTAPIIIETTPSYKNLFGIIERSSDRLGTWKTDFTKIKAGSLLQANGGYLVLNALDVLIEPGVWQALKRTLRHGVIEIQTLDPFYFLGTSALKPEPVESDAKVVMIGDNFLYYLLFYRDEDFKKIFKVKADFDSVMPKEERNIHEYACFIKKICDEDKLLPFDKSGVAAVVEYGVRVAGRQKKLSTRFTIIADL
ncbi:MAG: AAA family ATPase, partial [candidate division Zixibacteria bacterium]|nr:AAA family ATPase [candidate division Zixibacteria bacterium]